MTVKHHRSFDPCLFDAFPFPSSRRNSKRMESVEPLFFDQGHQPLPGLKDHLLFVKERYGYAPPMD